MNLSSLTYTELCEHLKSQLKKPNPRDFLVGLDEAYKVLDARPLMKISLEEKEHFSHIVKDLELLADKWKLINYDLHIKRTWRRI